MYPFDGGGTPTGASSYRGGALAPTMPLAKNGAGSGFALATVNATTGEVDARVLSPSGLDAGAVVAIIPAANVADTVGLVPAPTGYAAVWGQTIGTTHGIQVQLLDPQLNVVAGPLVVDDLVDDAYRGSIVYAPGSNVYLVSWHEKAVGGDNVLFSILGPDLSVKVPATIIASGSSDAVIASDGTGFWITWKVYTPLPVHLDGASIDASGVATRRPVLTSGGTPGKWVMLARDGQPVLVWTEVGGSGPDLYFDPMCAP